VDYLNLFNYLTSRGRLVSMVIADRENLLMPIVKESSIVYSIPETISKKEVERFKEYLFSIGLIETEAELYSLIDDPTINSSFFALMYTIIDETRRPLNNIIHDIYIHLNNWPKQVYEYVCLFNYYKINPNEELLIRATIDSYVTFRKEIEEGQLKKVIFSEGAEWDNIDYRVHHPIIAMRTIKMELNDPSIRVQKFLEILNKINPSLRHEIKKIERLLVFEIGPNSQEKEIPNSLKKEIFELVSSKIESRSIYHHYALLELEGDDKNFDHARQLLDKALQIKHNTTERDELILTSFGKFFSQRGYQLEDEGKLEEALVAYDSAESYFKKGRNRFFKNPYSYHGQTVLYRKRAEKSIEVLEKVKLFSKAMELCEEAISNLSNT
jgi:tetratricopeptide (TPR) repeat protein